MKERATDKRLWSIANDLANENKERFPDDERLANPFYLYSFMYLNSFYCLPEKPNNSSKEEEE